MTDTTPSGSTPSAGHRTALVLGGGGIAGIAWHLGMLSGLLDDGVPLDGADLVVGTSAGSVAGSILRFGQVPAVFAQQASAEMPDLPSADPSLPPVDIQAMMAQFQQIVAEASGPQDARARVGRLAQVASMGAGPSILLSTLSQQFPPEVGWPSAPLSVCVVDAADGVFRVIDASAGVELFRAVAASCSVPGIFPPVEIAGVPYVDGGLRSGTNADVAAGYDRVLVFACGAEPESGPTGPSLPEAVRVMSQSAEVLVITADAGAQLAFGPNPMAAGSRIPSALAGRRQAADVSAQVAEFWRGSAA